MTHRASTHPKCLVVHWAVRNANEATAVTGAMLDGCSACLNKVHRALRLQLRPGRLGQLRVEHDNRRRHGLALAQLLHKAGKALRSATDDDVVAQPRSLHRQGHAIQRVGVITQATMLPPVLISPIRSMLLDAMHCQQQEWAAPNLPGPALHPSSLQCLNRSPSGRVHELERVCFWLRSCTAERILPVAMLHPGLSFVVHAYDQ